MLESFYGFFLFFPFIMSFLSQTTRDFVFKYVLITIFHCTYLSVLLSMSDSKAI